MIINAKWEINGVRVNPLYLLLEEADSIDCFLESMEDGHPDEQEWIKKSNDIWAKIGELRKCALN